MILLELEFGGKEKKEIFLAIIRAWHIFQTLKVTK